MNQLIVSLAAFAGALISAGIGYLDARANGESFVWAKFCRSVLAGIVAAMVLGLSFTWLTVEVSDILRAIVGGAGFDAVSNRTIGAFKKPKTPIEGASK